MTDDIADMCCLLPVLVMLGAGEESRVRCDLVEGGAPYIPPGVRAGGSMGGVPGR